MLLSHGSFRFPGEIFFFRLDAILKVLKIVVFLRDYTLCLFQGSIPAGEIEPLEISLPLELLKNWVILEQISGFFWIHGVGISGEKYLTDIYDEGVSSGIPRIAATTLSPTI